MKPALGAFVAGLLLVAPAEACDVPADFAPRGRVEDVAEGLLATDLLLE